jgi:hypothetical protein
MVLYPHRTISKSSPVDTGVLASQFFAGFPTRQLLNLLANVDARAVFMKLLWLEQRKSYKTLVQSTTPCESSFSQIPQVRGTSTKPPVSEIQGKAPKLDRISDIKRTQSEYGLTFRHSKRKKREHCESWGGAWNDGVDDGGAYDKDRRARARRYTTNRASVRMFNKRRGLK